LCPGHLIQDAARVVGAAVPLTDLAERLFDLAKRAGHGREDMGPW
jgi:3-hydroxyisobutyrate dehydrogenase-like beta-hydroxyacid dehydrogenase